MSKKGGPRRNKVPEVDTQHLTDSLEEYVKAMGSSAGFVLGKYMDLQVQQAVSGPGLVDLVPLVKALHKVEQSLQFKYSDLVGSLKEVVRKFPEVKQGFPLSQQGNLPKILAERILVVCTAAAVKSGANSAEMLELEALGSYGSKPGNCNRDMLRKCFRNLAGPVPWKVKCSMLLKEEGNPVAKKTDCFLLLPSPVDP